MLPRRETIQNAHRPWWRRRAQPLVYGGALVLALGAAVAAIVWQWSTWPTLVLLCVGLGVVANVVDFLLTRRVRQRYAEPIDDKWQHAYRA